MLRRSSAWSVLSAGGRSRRLQPRDAVRRRRPRVALVLKTLNSPFFIEMQRGAEEAAKTLNVDLIVQAAEREIDVDKQMQIIENLIQAQGERARRHAVRIAGDRAGHRQGQPGRTSRWWSSTRGSTRKRRPTPA